jgi:hypothetical protein
MPNVKVYLNVKIRQCQSSECKNPNFLVCQNSESVKITNVSTLPKCQTLVLGIQCYCSLVKYCHLYYYIFVVI